MAAWIAIAGNPVGVVLTIRWSAAGNQGNRNDDDSDAKTRPPPPTLLSPNEMRGNHM